MQSDGGLTPMQQFCGSRAVLSGPAGGVVGYAVTSYSQMEKRPVIGFDMGGKSGLRFAMCSMNICLMPKKKKICHSVATK